MKSNFFVFFILNFCVLFGQSTEKTILVIDAATNLPIQDATIVLMKSTQIILTNSEGKGTFILKNPTNIQVSHTSFNRVSIRSISLKEKITTVLLKNNLNDLDELILTSQPQKVLKNLIDNSKRKLTIPARLKVYAREFFIMDDKYTYYNDGLINFQIFGKTKKIDSNILVEQNRSFGLIDQEISKDLLGYNLNDIMENYYNFKYLNPILETKAKKDYNFIVKVYSKNKQYNVITVIPVEVKNELCDEFNIIYEPKTNLIISVSSEIASKKTPSTANGSKNVYKNNFKSIYRNESGNYYLVSSKEEIGFEKIDKKQSKKIEIRNFFITSNFSTQNYSFHESEVFKDKTLFNKKNQILTEYWNVSGLTATEEELKVIQQIENNQ